MLKTLLAIYQSVQHKLRSGMKKILTLYSLLKKPCVVYQHKCYKNDIVIYINKAAVVLPTHTKYSPSLLRIA